METAKWSKREKTVSRRAFDNAYKKECSSIIETARRMGAKGSRRNNFPLSRRDLRQIWSIRRSKTAGLARLIRGFCDGGSTEDGVKIGCEMGSYFFASPKAATPEDIWRLHDYLTEKRKETDDKYDYRYSILLLLFPRLIKEGWMNFDDLEGLSEDKIAKIKLLVDM